MNNRIKELEPQCWEHNEFGLNFNYQKFAELIVKECADIGDIADDSGIWVGGTILTHFGVE